jgi:putative ABC transport system substrate-binding protein
VNRRAVVRGLILLGAATVHAREAVGANAAVKIGILTGDSPYHRDGVRQFRERMRDLGYTDDRVRFEERFAKSPDLLDAAARELAAANLDILVAFTTQAAMAAHAATKETPIVFGVVSDPVDAGLVRHLARPGGNATGLALMQPELSAKQLQLLKDLVPRLSRVAVIWNAGHRGKILEFRAIEAASRRLGVGVVSLPVRSATDFEPTAVKLRQTPVDGLIVLSEPLFAAHGGDILEWANHRLPVVGDSKEFAQIGSLMSFGPNANEQFRKAASYVDRIVKGAHPAELPVERPTRFELVINLKTAKVLGVTIPPSVLARADEIVE